MTEKQHSDPIWDEFMTDYDETQDANSEKSIATPFTPEISEHPLSDTW